HVDRVPAPFDRRDGKADRDLAVDLFGAEIQCGRSVFDLSVPRDCFGAKQNRLGEGRLSGTVVRGEGHVADLVGLEFLQRRLLVAGGNLSRFMAIRAQTYGTTAPKQASRSGSRA